ncbi:unnamed protein product [Anisakis simplex]|uniref:MSP domain-containing protein n=1 Tax=Anisakis simplex TaxID=6269 RepID=A0A0M3K9U4_ANISI|nr:unnamed protein product [Anisakis simplex]
MATATTASNTTPKEAEPVLSIDPDAAHFLISGGKSEHMLVNTGEKRVAVKASCNYHPVCPVYMFVEAGSCNNLVITRLPGPAKVDKLVFHYVTCNERDIDPKDVFKKKTKPDAIKLPMDTITPDDVLQVHHPSFAEQCGSLFRSHFHPEKRNSPSTKLPSSRISLHSGKSKSSFSLSEFHLSVMKAMGAMPQLSKK